MAAGRQSNNTVIAKRRFSSVIYLATPDLKILRNVLLLEPQILKMYLAFPAYFRRSFMVIWNDRKEEGLERINYTVRILRMYSK